jgi:hypothetical protein
MDAAERHEILSKCADHTRRFEKSSLNAVLQI